MMKQATTEGAKLGYQQAASDLASGKGSISKAMMRWNTNRRTGYVKLTIYLNNDTNVGNS
ncbi:hypothetical protein OFN55_30225, partial [Escherichia coli]|nr:hypothetical protein [Escherichia coli]